MSRQEAHPPTTGSRWVGPLRTLGLDIVGPLVVYRLCRDAGVAEVWSLVVSGALPAIGVGYDWLRWRTLAVVGAVVLGGIALSIALALVTDDPTVVLLEGSALTAAFGVASLGSLTRRRPLIFHFAQAFYGGRHSAAGAEMDTDFDRYAEARHFWRVVTTVWGLTYLAQAAVEAVVVINAGTQTALTFSRTVPWGIFGLLMAWTLWWGGRLKAQKPETEAGSGSAAEGEPDRD